MQLLSRYLLVGTNVMSKPILIFTSFKGPNTMRMLELTKGGIIINTNILVVNCVEKKTQSLVIN